MSTPSTTDNPLLQALIQSGQLYALAHYCHTIALFEQDHASAQIFSAIQAETLQHSQGHLDFLRQHSNLPPSSNTKQNRTQLAEQLRQYSLDCRNIWQKSLDEDRSDVSDWLENTAKATEALTAQLVSTRAVFSEGSSTES